MWTTEPFVQGSAHARGHVAVLQLWVKRPRSRLSDFLGVWQECWDWPLPVAQGREPEPWAAEIRDSCDTRKELGLKEAKGRTAGEAG